MITYLDALDILTFGTLLVSSFIFLCIVIGQYKKHRREEEASNEAVTKKYGLKSHHREVITKKYGLPDAPRERR